MAGMTWEKDENVAIVSMDNGANKHNQLFADTINDILDEVLTDADISAVVLRSTDEKNWSQGIDLDWIAELRAAKDSEAFTTFLHAMNEKVFKKLMLLPVPVIAAIGGHAFGNGALLACACDFRFMKADKGFFCLPEVDLGISFVPSLMAFARLAIPEYKFNEMLLSGRRLGAQELEEHHIIQKACADEDDLMREAISFAKGFKKGREIFATQKKLLYHEVMEIMRTLDPPVIEGMRYIITG